MANRPKLVLAGGGHAILPFLAHARKISDWADITLINEHRFLYYSGMIPEYLGGFYDQEDIRIDLERLCRENEVNFAESKIERLMVDERKAVTSDNRQFDYEMIVFDIGSVPPEIPQITGAEPVKPFHRLEILNKSLENRSIHNMTIVGGGAAGVELAMNISSRMREYIVTGDFRLHIIEKSGRLLPAFKKSLSEFVTKRLSGNGVDIHLSSTIKSYKEGTVTLESNQEIETDYLLTATGTVAQTLFRDAGLHVDSRGFLKVNDTLQCPDHPEIFAAGDCAHLISMPELKKTGVNAVKQGPVLRENITIALKTLSDHSKTDNLHLKAFSPYFITPLILSTGQKDAIWTTETMWIHHPLMLRLKHYIDHKWIRQYQYR